MTTFTVVWLKDAQDALAEIWMDHPDRDVVRAAATLIDRNLREAPKRYGTHISEGLWTIPREPLRAYYSVSEDDRLVEVGGLCLLSREGD
jgi:hypothetical protein